MGDETGVGKGSSRAALKVGQSLSHYEILEILCEGDGGLVYLAHDTKLDRRVALKCLPPALEADPEARERFLEGARRAASLDHPCIGNILDVGEEGSRVYFATELARGKTLEERLALEPLSPSEALDIASDIAGALETAHAQGIVHGGLSPKSVRLTETGHVKVEGFVQDVPALAYRSPEQIRGSATDERADIFSLGVVFYEMLTGVHPFRKGTMQNTAAAIVDDDAPALSAHGAEVPELLEHVVRKMLAKSPAERYQLVHEVRTDLEHANPPHPVSSEGFVEGYPTGATQRAKPRTEPTRMNWVSIVGVLTLPAIVLAWWFLTRPPPEAAPLSMAVLPLTNVSNDPIESDYLAQGISRAVITKLTQAGLRVTPWETAQRYAESTEPPERIARELNADAVLVGTFELVGDRIRTTLSLVDAHSGFQSWADEFEEPYEDLFGLQRRIAVAAARSLKRSLTGEEEEVLTTPESMNVDAYDYYLQGAHVLQSGTAEAAEIALQYFHRAVEREPGLADAHVGIGAVYGERYFSGWEGGQKNIDLASQSFERALALDPRSTGARRGLITLSWYQGTSEAALIQGQEAARLARSQDIDTLLARAQAYSYSGLNDRSLPLFRQILEIDPANQAAHWHLVVASFWAGEHAQAIEAGNIYLGRFGDDQMVHTKMAHSYFILDDYETAEVHYENATSAVSPQYHDAFIFAGLLLQRMGETERAEALWRRGIDLVDPLLRASPDSVRMRLLLAIFQGLLGETEAYLAELDSVMEVADFNAFELYYLAAAQVAMGDEDRAVEVIHRSMRQGRISYSWKEYLRMASPETPQSDAYTQFLAELEANDRRLREMY